MMVQKHKYQIIVNAKNKRNLEFIGEYFYGNIKEPTKIYLKDNAAIIEFSMCAKKKAEDIMYMHTAHIRDAFRKIFLLSAIKFDRGLDIKKIDVVIDGKTTSTEKSLMNLPAVNSMIPTKELGLNNTWADTTTLSSEIISKTKSKCDLDYRIISVYAYFASLGHEYEIDKFTYLWISMNAYYNEIDRLKNLGKDKKDDTQERIKLSQLLESIGYGVKALNKTQRDKHAEEYMKLAISANRLLTDEIETMYDALLNYPNSVLPETEFCKLLIELTEKIRTEDNENRNVTPFGLLLIEIAYYFRCRYFHGKKTTLLISTCNEWEYSILRVMNFFLKKFLNEHIPQLFENAK